MSMREAVLEYARNTEYREAIGLAAEPLEDYLELARGEYNVNYIFHPVGAVEPMVLRVNCGSQMHLSNQIEYEAEALELLKPSKRTPEVYYVDGSEQAPENGALVMEFLPGEHLDYKDAKQLIATAECLADIHSTRLPADNPLIAPQYPGRAILEECEEMLSVYLQSNIPQEELKLRLRALLDKAWTLVSGESEATIRCCINTELNSTNFLVERIAGDEYYVRLVDWEKPLLADPAQDLGHFLAPTTSFWKTDIILSEEDIKLFLEAYVKAVGDRFDTDGIVDRTKKYIALSCLRGISWCAMAWVQYQGDDKCIKNESTWGKLQDYLSDSFINRIESLLQKY